MAIKVNKKIHIEYFAVLRDLSGLDKETVSTECGDARQLFEELKKKYSWPIEFDKLKVAINDEFSSWDCELNTGDSVVFIPPVSGG